MSNLFMTSILAGLVLVFVAFSSLLLAGLAVITNDTGQPGSTLFGVLALALFAFAGILSAYILRRFKH
ncbi:MAG: hypothetical protein A3A30_00760 [Candidatus Terrybacteria bacterium RIFCSPLOWO2_01_FULL_48_14]|nr:MAG: hypothetical protein A3A30_00760 [Candidatus Terrybacteria bacterium RIFCSPLOWO2_01_FULL_48_14]